MKTYVRFIVVGDMIFLTKQFLYNIQHCYIVYSDV
jgi:hypothetical protein